MNLLKTNKLYRNVYMLISIFKNIINLYFCIIFVLVRIQCFSKFACLFSSISFWNSLALAYLNVKKFCNTHEICNRFNVMRINPQAKLYYFTFKWNLIGQGPFHNCPVHQNSVCKTFAIGKILIICFRKIAWSVRVWFLSILFRR